MSLNVFNNKHIQTRLDALILIGIYLSIFISSYVFFKSPFEFYLGYVIMLLLFPFFLGKFRIPSTFFVLASVFLITGVIHIYLGNNTPRQFIKIFAGLFLSYLFYYYVLKSFKLDINFLFRLYLKCAYIMGLIGLFQLASFIIGFKLGYDFRWILNKWGLILGGNTGIRINGLYPEPSQLAIVQAPAMFVAVYDLIGNRKAYYNRNYKSLIIIGCYFLSFSSLGYFGFLLAVILLLVNFGLVRYLLIIVPITLLLFNIAYYNVEEFQKRVDDTTAIFTTDKFELGKTHGSSIILYDNYNVALDNFKRNFLFGSGLGSHQTAFDRYSVTKHIRSYGFNGNMSDANSMFLRIVSETGLFGIILSIVFIIKNYVPRKEGISDEYWVLSNAVLTLILLFFFRQGHYFINGFPLFVLLYYYNKQKHDEDVKLLNSADKEE